MQTQPERGRFVVLKECYKKLSHLLILRWLVMGGSVASLFGYDTKVCGFDSQPAPLACL